MKIGFISLGCSKNLVDTEMMIGLIYNQGLEIVNDENEADIIVINTCGFIEGSKTEAIDTIKEMAKLKKTNKCKYIVVTGCLVQRYKERLEKELKDVDLFISIDEYKYFNDKIMNLINDNTTKNKSNNFELNYLDRYITTGNDTAYIKIAEGCSNFCTYCAIPYIRGRFQSRKMEDILEEAKKLNNMGIKELIVIAQDTTKYGIDIYNKNSLSVLLKKLCDFPSFKWIRVLYSYPESVDDELITVIKNNEKICKYFDIPIQHISNPILKKMNRKTTEEEIKEKILKIRKEIPNAILRTSLIVGFPGETDEDFKKLCEFIKLARFDKLGVFEYSREEGTVAFNFEKQIPEDIKHRRYEKIMKIQNQISNENLKKKIGNTYDVLVERVTSNYIIGRTKMDVPDMDGLVYIENNNNQNVNIGDFVKAQIIDSADYDLIGKLI